MKQTTEFKIFKKLVLEEAKKHYSNNIPSNIKIILNKELEYIQEHELIDTIYMIENMLHYDKKYIGSTYLSGDLEASLVLYILGLTKKPDNYQISSFNNKTFYIEFNVDELFLEDIKNEFMTLYEERIINDEGELLFLKGNYDVKDLDTNIKDYCNIVSFNTYNLEENAKKLKVRVLKGTDQIGGCITEIESKEARIIIDFGEDLPDDEVTEKRENPMIDGLTTGVKNYDAVFITHSHGDHIGLIDYILDDIPVYVEKESKEIYRLLNTFTSKNIRFTTKDMEFEKPIIIKDMKITLFIVDHSSYNSGMLLIESNDKRILHTGDYRRHGRKGKIFEMILNKIGKVDLLITEGTTFGRKQGKYKTEEELEIKAVKEFKKYNQVFILQSSTNIDRIVTFYKASKKTNKIFIEDIFTANVTEKINSNIPTPKKYNDVYAFIPLKYQSKPEKFQNKYYKQFEKKSNPNLNDDFTMLVKISMLEDIKRLKEQGLITNACLVYSMWDGYLKKDSFKNFKNSIKDLGIKYKYLHTSGHGDDYARKTVERITQPKKVVIIHTTDKERGKEIFKNVIDLEDGEQIEI